MVEPTTLVCGHNFCQLCIVFWALTSKQKKCPTCRQVWRGHPRVNTALRNMEHKVFGDKITNREKEVLSDQESQAKIREYERQMSVSGQEEIEEVVVEEEEEDEEEDTVERQYRNWVSSIIVVAMIGHLLWYWRTSDYNQTLHMPPVRWKTSDVATWMIDMGWAEEYVDIVHQKGIDGSLMLSLNEDDLSNLLNMTNPDHKIAFSMAVAQVRYTGLKVPNTLWGYKALYPGRCLFLLYGLKDFPRGTLLYLYIFNYEDMFLPFLHFIITALDDNIPGSKVCPPTTYQWVVFLVFAVLMPYWLMMKLTWSMIRHQFWSPLVILVSCPLLTFSEVSMVMNYIGHARWRFTVPLLKEHCRRMAIALLTSAVWQMMPRIISDVMLYVSLYVIPIYPAKYLYNEVKYRSK